MLAHLLLPASSRSRPFVLGLMALTAAAMLAGPAKAADMLPLGKLEADATGQVSKAETLTSGAIVTGVTVQTSAAAIDSNELATTSANERGVLRDANRGVVHLGVGLTQRLSLSLGVSGTYEHVKPEERDALFPSGLAVDGEGWRQNVKQSGFSGATLAVKVLLADYEGFKLSLAPFVESGAGEQATYSLTRSVSPKAGFLTAMSYGAKGVGDATINAGYRYRDPEEVGGLILRNEAFYRMALTAYVTRDVGIFVAGEGRRLMVAKADALKADGKPDYLPKESGEVTAGASIQIDDMNIAAFAGTRVKGTNGFGYGKMIAGLQFTTTIGNYHGSRPKHSFATAIDRQDERAKRSAAVVEVAKPVTSTNDYPEMIGSEIDPLDAIDGSTDFDHVKGQMEAQKKVKPEVSEEDKVAAELEMLRNADDKVTAERMKIDDEERASERRAAIKKSSKDDKLMQEWMKDAEQDAGNLEGITEEEVNWQGLED